MSNLLVDSVEEIQKTKELLAKNLPNYRQAYSDRTSWLMACISELAYVKFNPLFKSKPKDYLIKQLAQLIDENKIKSLTQLIQTVNYDPETNKKELEENLDFLNLKLVETFDSNGTQAILIENEQYIFLGFRGTEATSIKDIKSDVNATTMACDSGGKIHSGFSDAFDQVSIDIQSTINQDQFKTKPLFITGHSLGGALATIAAKKLTHKGGIAACYTFGSPRVGNIEWTTNIKTPIYRVVNAIDPVTMLPPSSVTIECAAWIFGQIPAFGAVIKQFLHSKFGGYLHSGDMRYLSDCKDKNYSTVKLLYGVSLLFRMRTFFKNSKSWSSVPADHSILVYRKKLKIIAGRRGHLR